MRNPKATLHAALRVTAAAAVGAALVLHMASGVRTASPRFYDDDPIWVDDDRAEDASGVQPWILADEYLAYESTLKDPGEETRDVRAQNLNTIDEVPDSSWFTNRVGREPLTPADVTRGVCETEGPLPGNWVVSEGKVEGDQLGFTITDTAGIRWFVKFDPPGYPEMATGAEVVVSRLLWALGYNVPEYHVAYVKREQLTVGEGALVQPPGAYTRQMREKDLDLLFKYAPRLPDGRARVVASRALVGAPLGPFRFSGTRPDDPNDIVPHEHRRELRGLLVFSAWLNHVKAQASNTLDTLVRDADRAYVRHNLLDFGSTLGSGGVRPQDYGAGHEYLVDPKRSLKRLAALGFAIDDWRTVPLHETESVGRLPRDGDAWDPGQWKPQYSNAAFRRVRADDQFWAARKVMGMTDELIKGAVKAGQYTDADAEAFLVTTLTARRDAIGRAYLPAINPVVDPALDSSGTLTFRSAAVDAGVAPPPARYRAQWARFDNATGETQAIGESSGPATGIMAPAGLPAGEGTYVRVGIAAAPGTGTAWETPLHAYFRRTATGWMLVGLERLPETTLASSAK